MAKLGDKSSVPQEVDGAFSSDSQQSSTRPRALSDISTQMAESDVGAVVLKAKRAAKSLWMIIHAQNCRIAGNCCPHRGCQDTKKLLLHVKSCPAGPGFGCPDGFNGCLQAKKLLSHYRRCRDIRARQARQPPAKRLLRQQQHSCLVCSLMARHARSVLDAGMTASPLSCSATTKEVKRKEKSVHLHRPEDIYPNDSSESMPPPPPRLPQLPLCSSQQTGLDLNKEISSPSQLSLQLSSSDLVSVPSANQSSVSTGHPISPHPTDEIQPMYCTPPSQSVLLQQRIANVAAVAAPSPMGGAADSSLLGKSFDSSKSSLLSRQSLPESEDASEIKNVLPLQSLARQRPRAESYDERSRSSSTMSSIGSDSPQRHGNDPTIEASLKSEHLTSQSVQNVELSQSQLAKQLRFGERRSASCGVLSTLSSGCDTISEHCTFDDDRISEDGDPIFICEDEKR